jgi:hypothetical protein
MENKQAEAAKAQAKQYAEVQKNYGSGDMTLENMIETMFIVKNLDDLFLAYQSCLQSLKQNPFNPKLLERRDKVQHDITALQPLVAAMGVRFARHIEKKYGMRFKFINGGASEDGGKSDLEKNIESAVEQHGGKKAIILPPS